MLKNRHLLEIDTRTIVPKKDNFSPRERDMQEMRKTKLSMFLRNLILTGSSDKKQQPNYDYDDPLTYPQSLLAEEIRVEEITCSISFLDKSSRF